MKVLIQMKRTKLFLPVSVLFIKSNNFLQCAELNQRISLPIHLTQTFIKNLENILESQTKKDENLLQKKPTAKYASKLKKINGKDIKPKNAAFWSFVYKSAGKYGSKIPRLNALNKDLFEE